MNQAIRSMRTHPPAVILTSSNHIRRRISGVSFRQVTTMAGKPENTNKTNDSSNEIGNEVMSDSFGEGYATRSDEEGFGGIYGGDQTMPKVEIDKKIHENHPAYDKTQGSEVKEKEKGRHQTNVGS